MKSKTRKAHGVAICLDQTATKVWKDSGSEWEPISEHIVKIRLQCTPIHITACRGCFQHPQGLAATCSGGRRPWAAGSQTVSLLG